MGSIVLGQSPWVKTPARLVLVTNQNISDLRQNHELQRAERDHLARHAGRDAARVIGIVAVSAFGLIGKAFALDLGVLER